MGADLVFRDKHLVEKIAWLVFVEQGHERVKKQILA